MHTIKHSSAKNNSNKCTQTRQKLGQEDMYGSIHHHKLTSLLGFRKPFEAANSVPRCKAAGSEGAT